MPRWASVGTVLAALAGALLFAGLSGHALWLPDEPREAEIAREFSLREGWAVPSLNGGRWLEKPPLWHWCAATLFRLAGEATPGLARIPSAVAGLLMGLTAWMLAAGLGRRALAPWAAFLAWTSAELVNTSHRATVDCLFSAWTALAIACFALGQAGRLKGWAVWAMAAAALAFLTKFHLGPALFAACVLAWCLARRTAAPVKALLRPLPVLAFLVVAAPWPWLLHRHEAALDADYARIETLADRPAGVPMAPEATAEILWGQLLHRSTGNRYGHANPFWYYVQFLPTFAAPWSLLLPFALPWAWRRLKQNDPLVTLALCWILSAFVLLSIPKAKRVVYLTPCVPAVALLIATWGEEKLAGWNLRRLALGLGAGLLALSAAFPALARWQSGGPCAAAPAWAWGLGAAAVWAGILALRGMPRLGLAFLGGWLLLLAAAVGKVVVPEVDLRESHDPAARELLRLAEPERRAVVGYALSENQQGAFAFSLKRRVRCYTEGKHLKDRLKASPCVVVTSWDSYQELGRDAELADLIRLEGEGQAGGVRLAFLQSVP